MQIVAEIKVNLNETERTCIYRTQCVLEDIADQLNNACVCGQEVKLLRTTASLLDNIVREGVIQEGRYNYKLIVEKEN